jgi:hypothetical protein
MLRRLILASERHRTNGVLLGTATILLLTGAQCAGPAFSDCAIQCAPDGDCPHRLRCSNGYCSASRVCPAPSPVDGLAGGAGAGGNDSARAGASATSDAGGGQGSGGQRVDRGTGGESGATAGSAAGRTDGGGVPGGVGGVSGVSGGVSGASGGVSGASGGESGGSGAGGEPPAAGRGAGSPPVIDVSRGGDPSVRQPNWSAWTFGQFVSHSNPASYRTGADTFRIVALAPDNTLIYLDLLRLPVESVVVASGLVTSGLFLDDPLVVSSEVVPAEVFTIGHDEQIYRVLWDGTQWRELVQSGMRAKRTPAAAVTDSGILVTLSQGLDQHVWWRQTPFDLTDGHWVGGWLDTELETDFRPAVAAAGDRVHLAVTRRDRSVAHAVWSGEDELEWSELAGVRFDSPPVLVARTKSIVDLLGRGTDDCLYLRSSVDGDWTSWFKISGPVSSNPLAVANGPAGLYVFVKDERGNVSSRRFDGSWGEWVDLGGGLSLTVREDFPGSALVLGENDVELMAMNADAGLFLRRTLH